MFSCPIGYTGVRKEVENVVEFQIKLAAARINADMTQEEAARKMQVTKQTIINWEKGRVAPGIPEIQMMSRMYNIPQDYIFLPSYSTKSREKEQHNKKMMCEEPETTEQIPAENSVQRKKLLDKPLC